MLSIKNDTIISNNVRYFEYLKLYTAVVVGDVHSTLTDLLFRFDQVLLTIKLM